MLVRYFDGHMAVEGRIVGVKEIRELPKIPIRDLVPRTLRFVVSSGLLYYLYEYLVGIYKDISAVGLSYYVIFFMVSIISLVSLTLTIALMYANMIGKRRR